VVAGLPVPEVNVWIELPGGGVEVDFLWREARVVVETDSHRFHGTRAAFERDRGRDQRLAVAGFGVLRFTWRQRLDDPAEVARTVRAVLDDRLPPSRPARLAS